MISCLEATIPFRLSYFKLMVVTRCTHKAQHIAPFSLFVPDVTLVTCDPHGVNTLHGAGHFLATPRARLPSAPNLPRYNRSEASVASNGLEERL